KNDKSLFVRPRFLLNHEYLMFCPKVKRWKAFSPDLLNACRQIFLYNRGHVLLIPFCYTTLYLCPNGSCPAGRSPYRGDLKTKPRMITFSNKEARHLILCNQGLLQNFFGDKKEGALKVIEHLGYVQIDTIAVVERAHHHT